MAADVQPWQILAGKWQVDRSENFEDFLKEMGVNVLIRKIALKASASVAITIDGDKVTILFSTGFMKTHPNTFHVNSGTETDAVFTGKTVKAKTTWEDGKLITFMSASADGEIKAQKVSREIINGELVQTMEIGAVVCRRFFKHIP